MSVVEVGGLTFSGSRFATGLRFRRFVDWDSLPDTKSLRNSRPGAHGTFRTAEDFREGLVLTLEGWYRGSTRVEALQMRRELTGRLAEQDLKCTFTDELGSLSREVSIDGVNPGDLIDTRFDFTIDMFAYDPRKYGPSAAASTGVPTTTGGRTWPATWPVTWTGGGSTGRVTAANPGNADTYSLFEATGGLSGGFSATELATGREIRFERDIPVDSTVFINPRTGAAYIDAPSNDVSGFLTRSDYTVVPKRSQSVWQFFPLGTVTGTPMFTVRTAPAYW